MPELILFLKSECEVQDDFWSKIIWLKMRFYLFHWLIDWMIEEFHFNKHYSLIIYLNYAIKIPPEPTPPQSSLQIK